MRSLVCNRPGALAVEDRPRPQPGAGEVLVRIRRAGVCGTDLHIFEGSHPFLEYPRVIGHELSGEVADRGPGCTIPIGQQVYIIPYLACGACVACRRGKTNCCQRIAVLGVHIDGGMADYVCVPEANVARADGVTLDQAAMVEFLAIGAHAVRRANPRRATAFWSSGRDRSGSAACCSQACRTARSQRSTSARTASTSAASGLASITPSPRGRMSAKRCPELTGGDFFDIVIDATGNAKSMMAGLNYVAHGGTYVLVSVVHDTISFADPEFHKRETTLLGSRNATPEDFSKVFDAMREGRVPTESLITHRVALEEAPGGFPLWIKPEAGVIKALIEI